MLFLHGSNDLLLLVHAATNTVKKRLDMASRSLADFLNVSVFGAAGPVKAYAKPLGATGEHAGISLLDGFCGSEYKKALFPTSDVLAAGSPLVKGDYQSKRELHFTIGMLRVFDAQVILAMPSSCTLFPLSLLYLQENASVPGQDPRCNFHDMNKRYLRGAAMLPTYGQMWFPIVEAILPSLSTSIWNLYESVKDEEDVDRALEKTFQRQAKLILVAYSRLSSKLIFFAGLYLGMVRDN